MTTIGKALIPRTSLISQWVPDSAQVTHLVGLYLLSQIGGFFPNLFGVLYRDDALFVIQECSGTRLNWLRKSVIKFLKDFFSLDIVSDLNYHAINFLDVTLNFNTWLYCPFCRHAKLIQLIQHINTGSNHPVSMISGIVNAVSVRLSIYLPIGIFLSSMLLPSARPLSLAVLRRK